MTMPDTIWASDAGASAPLDASVLKYQGSTEYVLRSSVQAMIDAALATPPDADTRVVSVEMLGLMIRSLNSIPGSEYYHDDTIHKVANALRAIIEGKDQ